MRPHAKTGGGGGNTSHSSVASNPPQNLNTTLNPALSITPNLATLASSYVNFSHTAGIGGLEQVSGTGWTIAGTISYLCGIPLDMPIAGNSFANKYFLDSAVCVSDVLSELGYTQRYLSGLDSSFSGMRYFLGSHAISVLDLPALQAQGKVPDPLPKELQGFWGLKDSALLALAKDELESLPEPFVLYVSTIDTHHPNGFVDKQACPGLGDSYQEAFTCADRLLAEFIAKAQAQFGESLTIILLGDHLSHKGDGFFDTFGKRSIYNLFINPKFTAKYNQSSLKKRQMSHFDITPLILDSLGVETRAFGLGRNPLYGATLLESTYTKSALNAELGMRNRLYNSFWEVNYEKTRR